MKVIIEISKAEAENGQEMVLFGFSRESHDDDTLAVLRATARIELAISQEYAKIHAESGIVKGLLDERSE